MGRYKKYADMKLKSAVGLNKLELWNKAGKDCVSYCEKRLKDWLEDNHLLSEALERTHNLKILFRSVPEFDKGLYKSLALISGYYFETVYSGDNAIYLDSNDVEEALEICNQLDAYLNEKIPDNSRSLEEFGKSSLF